MDGTNCNRCNKEICTPWRTANGKYYHFECYTCAICDKLIENTNQIKSRLKEIYCDECHKQYFSKTCNSSDSVENAYDCVTGKKIRSKKVKRKDNQNPYDVLHAYSTPVNSFHEIDMPALVVSTKLEFQTHKGFVDKQESNNNTEIGNNSDEGGGGEIIITSRNKNTSINTETTERPKMKKSSTPKITLNRETSTDKRLLQRSRSKIPVLKSKTRISHKPLLEESKEIISPVERRGSKASSRIKIPLQTRSSKMNDYLNSKGSRHHEIGPSKNMVPIKGTHYVSTSVPKASPPVSPPKNSFPRNMSHGPRRISYPNILNKTNDITPVNLPQQECHNNCCTKLSVQTISYDLNGRPSSNYSNPYMNIKPRKCSQRKIKVTEIIENNSQVPNTEYWNNIPPSVLPSNQQLLSVMLSPGERTWGNDNSMTLDPSITDSSSSSGFSQSHKPTSIRGTLDCPICFESLIELQNEITSNEKCLENVVTGCGHIFHQECINNWLGTNGNNNRCPICLKICIRNSLIPVYLDANAGSDVTGNDNGSADMTLSTLRSDYKQLLKRYTSIQDEHKECGIKCAVSDSLRSAYDYEVECRVKLQWENKRLQRKIDELLGKMKVSQGDKI